MQDVTYELKILRKIILNKILNIVLCHSSLLYEIFFLRIQCNKQYAYGTYISYKICSEIIDGEIYNLFYKNNLFIN